MYKEFHWMYPLTAAICIKMQQKRIHKYQIWDHTGSIQKQPSAGIWKRILETWKLRKNNHERPSKLSVSQKRNIFRQTKRLQQEMGNFPVKKRVLVNAGIPPFISEETVRKVLQKTDVKWTHFQRKENMSKNDLKLTVEFARKVYCKHASCNYEIWNHQKAYGNITLNHNFNVLPHALPYVLPYIFSDISLVLGYLQRFTTCYGHFFKKNINIDFFYKFDGNAC